MTIEWETTLSGKCESCVFGDTRLAMNCPKMRDVFYEHYRTIKDIKIGKCIHNEKITRPVEEKTSEYSVHTSSTEEGHCENL